MTQKRVSIAFFSLAETKLKCGFSAIFGALMTKIDIQNPKLIVTNDYQQFLVHFEYFLSLFQISDEKLEFLLVMLKVPKNGIFFKIRFLAQEILFLRTFCLMS